MPRIILHPCLCWLLMWQSSVLLAQSFTGAEFGETAENYEAENAEADSGLNSATPSNNVDEVGDYGDYGNAVGDYGLGGEPTTGATDGEANYSDYGGGNGGNIFDSQYENYQQTNPANPTVTNPAVSNPAVSNPAVSNPAVSNPAGTYNSLPTTNNIPTISNSLSQPPTQQANQLLMQAEAEYQAPATQNVAPQTPIVSGSPNTVAPALAPEDGNLYYPTDEDPAGPVAPPLPPPNEFSGAPPVPGSMRIMAEGEAPEVYAVEPGDTLFDICDQLLDEPAYWPKLWALNPEIKNPHFIYPGMKLRFYPGDEESPPYLQVVAEEDVIPIDKGELDESQLILEPIKFVTDDYAETDPVEVVGIDQVQVGEDVGFSGGNFVVPPIELRIPGFIYSDEKEPLGYVRTGRQAEMAGTTGTRLFFEQASGLSAGTTYTVLRYGREVENPETGDFVGYLYYWVGNVTVERNVDSEYSTGIVTESRLGARPGDILVEFVSTNRTTSADYAVSGLASVDANVVGFGEEWGELGAQGQFAFIDLGSGGGVSPGMHIPVFTTPRSYVATSLDLDLPVDYEQVGVIRILDATPAGAVGIIVQSSDAIRMGDRTDKG